MGLDSVGKYKNRLLRLVCGDAAVAELLGGEPGAGLVYTSVFPYDRIDGIVGGEKTFIAFDVDAVRAGGRASLDFDVTFWLVTHRNLMRMDADSDGYPGATRLDMLASAVESAVAGDSGFGIGRLALATGGPLRRFEPAEGFAGRILKFSARNFT